MARKPKAHSMIQDILILRWNTLDLWELFKNKVYEVYISDIVIREISGCSEEKLKILLDYLNQIDYNIIETTEDTVELAGKFIDFGILSIL